MNTEIELDGHVVKLSNPDKVLYPGSGFTKADIVNYYLKIAPAMIPHLRDRPLTLKRYPNGVDGDFFFKKQCPKFKPEWMRTITMPVEDGKREVSFCSVDNSAGLVWLANLAALELHANLQRAPRLDNPTAVVFDLDPGAPADIVQCCEVALTLKQMLDQLNLECFAKTSGSKGLQMYVPLNGDEASFDQTSEFAFAIAEVARQQRPDLIVTNMKKSLRDDKVLIDWSQNSTMKTTVAVYSLRARSQPTVSTPVEWSEVEQCAIDRCKQLLEFEPADVLRRVSAVDDLFSQVLKMRQILPNL